MSTAAGVGGRISAFRHASQPTILGMTGANFAKSPKKSKHGHSRVMTKTENLCQIYSAAVDTHHAKAS